MIPRSRKGKGDKKTTHYSAPLPAALITALRVAAAKRPATARLLLKPSGDPWAKSDHSRLFARAVERAGQDKRKITMYALRHSNIVRQLLAGIPIRVVADKHDTSVAMIERN